MAAQAVDPVGEYVRLLGAFGLPPAELRAAHGADGDGSALRRAVREDVGERPAALYRRAHRLLARSSRGVDASRRYWNHAPVTQLDEVFAAYGCRFEVRDPETGAETVPTADEPVELAVREPEGGRGSRTRFSYPDTPLGDDNYPALVATVDEQLLDGTGLRFVALSDVTDRWRFVLVAERALARLRERHGERVEFADRPLLREHQPAAYTRSVDDLSADELARLPSALVPEPRGSLTGREPLADRTDASFERVAERHDRAPDATFDHGDGPSAARLAAAQDPRAVVTDGGAGATTHPSGETTDERVADLFADLDGVALSRAGDEAAADRAPDGRVDVGPDDYDPDAGDDAPPEGDLDEVFEHVEAVAAETPAEPVAADDGVTSSDVLDAIGHENAASDPEVEDGFVWVDPEQLTPAPEAVYEAMLGG
jgi:hypothetical protein